MSSPEANQMFHLEMYRSRPRLYYEAKGEGMYLAKIFMKGGLVVHELKFTCEGKATPYNFVLDFVTTWLFSKPEIGLIELSRNGQYFESYVPREGWFKKEV